MLTVSEVFVRPCYYNYKNQAINRFMKGFVILSKAWRVSLSNLTKYGSKLIELVTGFDKPFAKLNLFKLLSLKPGNPRSIA